MNLGRTTLMVPGHRPEMFAKAAQTKATTLILDLEDSVPEQHKELALRNVESYLESSPVGKVLGVRVNAGTRGEAEADSLPARADFIMIPKVRFWEDVYTSRPVMLVIETPMAILHLESLLSIDAVIGATFGLADFAAGMGVSDRIGTKSYQGRFSYARQKTATVCAAFGKPAYDTCPYVKGPDAEYYITWWWEESYCEGFTGAACIHPTQVRIAQRVFPTEGSVAWALETLGQHDARGGEVGTDASGLVVGMPVARQAAAIIKVAEVKK